MMKRGKIKKNSSRRGKKRRHRNRTLGAVSSLEEYVPPDWWRRIFNAFYLKTDGDVVNDQHITNHELDLFIEILKLSPDERILDLCCGQGRHSLELARRGFLKVEGLDRSRYLVEKARAQAKKEGLEVRFREGDARELHYTANTFDVVLILGNSFGYFEDIQDDMEVLKEVSRVLKPMGRLLIDVADGEYLREHFEKRSWEWIGNRHYVLRERTLSKDKQRLISREIIAHIGNGIIRDQFYAERLYTREALSELLRQAGFGDICIHGEVTPDSQRNQDLGMMERRIIITAVCMKELAPVQGEREKATMSS